MKKKTALTLSGAGVDEITLIFAEDLNSVGDLHVFLACLVREVESSALKSVQARQELINLFALASGMCGGAVLGEQWATRIFAVLLERLRGESDRKIVETICDVLGSMTSELCEQRDPFGEQEQSLEPLSGKVALQIAVVPLFKLMREPDSAAQKSGARALAAVVADFPDRETLQSHEIQIVTPLLKFFGKREFSAKLELVEAVTAVCAKLKSQLRPNLMHAAFEMSKSALNENGGEHSWPLRRAGINLAVQLLRYEKCEEIQVILLGLRYDKTDLVRHAAVAAVEEFDLAPPPAPRPPNSSLASRTPVRSRAANDEFFESARKMSFEEVQVKSAGPTRQQAVEEEGAVLRELRELKTQQAQVLATVGALAKAVESGMRTLNARVRSLEEQMQDLTDAVDERA